MHLYANKSYLIDVDLQDSVDTRKFKIPDALHYRKGRLASNGR